MKVLKGLKFNKKLNSQNKIDSDKSLIIKLMNSSASNEFIQANPEDFSDKELAEAFNNLINNLIKNNNSYVMSLNDTMELVGNTGIVKDMIQSVTQQSNRGLDV